MFCGDVEMKKVFEDNVDEKQFERQCALYQSDPAEFERQVREKIDEIIQNADPKYRKRLQGLQFTIDCTLKKYKDPVARMNKMVELFWEGFLKFRDAHNALSDLAKNSVQSTVDTQPETSADIIPFSQKNK